MNTDRRPGSRMPDDPAYWQDLAARFIDAALDPDAAVSGAVEGRVAADVGSGAAEGHVAADIGSGAAESRVHTAGMTGVAVPWWQSLSDAAYMLAASALLALLGGTQLVDDRAPATTGQTHVIESAIVPEDDLLATLVSTDEPPPGMAMLWVVARREIER